MLCDKIVPAGLSLAFTSPFSIYNLLLLALLIALLKLIPVNPGTTTSFEGSIPARPEDTVRTSFLFRLTSSPGFMLCFAIIPAGIAASFSLKVMFVNPKVSSTSCASSFDFPETSTITIESPALICTSTSSPAFTILPESGYWVMTRFSSTLLLFSCPIIFKVKLFFSTFLVALESFMLMTSGTYALPSSSAKVDF